MGVELLLGLVQPQAEAVKQFGLAERAAFFTEQSAGLQTVQQPQPNLAVTRRQGLAARQVGRAPSCLKAQTLRAPLRACDSVSRKLAMDEAAGCITCS
jgi:hypothetical protein